MFGPETAKKVAVLNSFHTVSKQSGIQRVAAAAQLAVAVLRPVSLTPAPIPYIDYLVDSDSSGVVPDKIRSQLHSLCDKSFRAFEKLVNSATIRPKNASDEFLFFNERVPFTVFHGCADFFVAFDAGSMLTEAGRVFTHEFLVSLDNSIFDGARRVVPPPSSPTNSAGPVSRKLSKRSFDLAINSRQVSDLASVPARERPIATGLCLFIRIMLDVFHEIVMELDGYPAKPVIRSLMFAEVPVSPTMGPNHVTHEVELAFDVFSKKLGLQMDPGDTPNAKYRKLLAANIPSKFLISVADFRAAASDALAAIATSILPTGSCVPAADRVSYLLLDDSPEKMAEQAAVVLASSPRRHTIDSLFKGRDPSFVAKALRALAKLALGGMEQWLLKANDVVDPTTSKSKAPSDVNFRMTYTILEALSRCDVRE